MGRGDSASASALQQASDAIEAASAAIDEDCNRSFALVEAATFDLPVLGYDRRLDTPDFVSITTLKVDDDDDGVYEVTIDASAFEPDSWHTHGGYVAVDGTRQTWPFEFVTIVGRYWPTGKRRRLVQIEADWGWPVVPAAINQACSILATRIMQRATAAPFGVQNFGELGSQSIRSTDPDYLALIAPYRKHGIA